MITDRDYLIAEKMIVYGGSFVKKLGELFYKADNVNKEIVKDSFKHYWQQYEKFVGDNDE